MHESLKGKAGWNTGLHYVSHTIGNIPVWWRQSKIGSDIWKQGGQRDNRNFERGLTVTLEVKSS